MNPMMRHFQGEELGTDCGNHALGAAEEDVGVFGIEVL